MSRDRVGAPPPAAELGDFPPRRWSQDQPLYRIYTDDGRHPAFFATGQAGRFNPPPGFEVSYGVCYLAASPVGAFLETFGRFSLLTREVLAQRVMARAYLADAGRLADFTDPAVIGRYRLSGEISAGAHDTTYQVASAWSCRLWQAGFDGIYYSARHDPSGAQRSVALFGKPGEDPTRFAALRSEGIPAEVVSEAQAQYGFTILPAAPLR